MASSYSDWNPQFRAEYLGRLMYECLDDGIRANPDRLYTAINGYLRRQLGDDIESLSLEQIDWVQQFLSDSIWEYIQTHWYTLSEILLYLGEWDPCLFSNQIAYALYHVHDKIAETGMWDRWITYCYLVGTLIEEELNLIEHEHRVLRIMIQAFDDQINPSLRDTLMAGAATCMSKVAKPVAQYIGGKEWNMEGFSVGTGTKQLVAPADWQHWAGLLEVFGHDHSQDRDTRRAARKAARVMRI